MATLYAVSTVYAIPERQTEKKLEFLVPSVPFFPNDLIFEGFEVWNYYPVEGTPPMYIQYIVLRSNLQYVPVEIAPGHL